MKFYYILMCFLLIGGCATQNDVKMAESYYKYQSKEQKPILTIIAKQGQTISFQGVERLEVYAPGNDNPISQFKTQYHPVWSIIGETLRYAAPAMVSGYWAKEIVNVAGKRAGYSIGGNSVGGNYDASDSSIGQDYDASDSSIGGDNTGGDNIGQDYDASDSSNNENWNDNNSTVTPSLQSD